MANGLLKIEEYKEGDFFCRWLKSRLIVQNKNVLGVELGPTGSGKSYRDLRKAELWYQYHFKEKFPVNNICFGTLQAMELISSGSLRRGEIIIFEEAGANLGNLDFQSKISKMFSYVLQSFRSMNIGIFFNLPYFSMLNKSARMLMHYKSESGGVDHNRKVNRCKFFLHQVNQSSGKIYAKSPKVKYKGKIRKIKKFTYKMPSQYLVDAYEKKKKDYLDESTKEYTLEMQRIKEKDSMKDELLPHQRRAYDLRKQGKNLAEIGEIEGKTAPTIQGILATLRKRGYNVERGPIDKKSIENVENKVSIPITDAPDLT